MPKGQSDIDVERSYIADALLTVAGHGCDSFGTMRMLAPLEPIGRFMIMCYCWPRRPSGGKGGWCERESNVDLVRRSVSDPSTGWSGSVSS